MPGGGWVVKYWIPTKEIPPGTTGTVKTDFSLIMTATYGEEKFTDRSCTPGGAGPGPARV